ncbi:MAG: hypothetical protein JSS49_27220 [Planctomycetes bacterium]|nr:hypothetical protein [Planctomycetota bacterium]
MNQILSDTRRLPPPLFGDPKFAAEPIEVQLKKIQNKYEPGPASRIPDVAKYPKAPPEIVDAGPVTVGGTQWSEFRFQPGGSLTAPGWNWTPLGAGSWTQTGNKIAMHWKTKSVYHGTYFFPEHWAEYTVNAQISGDTMTGTMIRTIHTTRHGQAPETTSQTLPFSAKRKD